MYVVTSISKTQAKIEIDAINEESLVVEPDLIEQTHTNEVAGRDGIAHRLQPSVHASMIATDRRRKANACRISLQCRRVTLNHRPVDDAILIHRQQPGEILLSCALHTDVQSVTYAAVLPQVGYAHTGLARQCLEYLQRLGLRSVI